MTEISKVINDIIKSVDNNKGDTNLYLIIFNIITDKNSIRNYTNNSNGIFFNMNSISLDLLKVLDTKIKSYLNSKDELKSLEEKRDFLLNEMGLTIDTSYKTELKEFLNTNKKGIKLSTEIDIDIDSEKNIEPEKNETEEKINSRIRKSVEKFNKPFVYKGTYDRINKILNKTRSSYTRNKAILEDDVLFNKDMAVIEEVEEQEEDLEDEEQEETELQEEDEEDEEPELDEEEEDLFGQSSDEEEKDIKSKKSNKKYI